MGTNFTDFTTTDLVNAASLNDRFDELDRAIPNTSINLVCNSQYLIDNQTATGGGLTSFGYLADQFLVDKNVTGGVVNFTRVPNPATNPLTNFALQIATAAATFDAFSYALLLQPFEAQFIHSLVQDTFYLSFVAQASVTGIYAASLRDGASAVSYVMQLDLVAGVPKKFTFKIPAPTIGIFLNDNTLGLLLTFNLVAGITAQTSTLETWVNGNFNGVSSMTNPTTGNLLIAEILLSRGNVPYFPNLPSVDRVYAARYFEKSWAEGVVIGTATGFGTRVSVSGTAATDFVQHTVHYQEKRTSTPNVTLYDSAGAAGFISYMVFGGPNNAGQTGNAAEIINKSFRAISDNVTAGKVGIMTHWVVQDRMI